MIISCLVSLLFTFSMRLREDFRSFATIMVRVKIIITPNWSFPPTDYERCFHGHPLMTSLLISLRLLITHGSVLPSPFWLLLFSLLACTSIVGVGVCVMSYLDFRFCLCRVLCYSRSFGIYLLGVWFLSLIIFFLLLARFSPPPCL